MLRIVVDTNVFIRAIFHADRHSQQVLKLVSGGRVVMVMTHQIQEEVLLAVAGHAWHAGVDFEQARRPLQKALRLTQKAEFVEAPPVFTACDDSSDNKFFDCAIAGRADYIVTTDSHLQQVPNPPVPVVSPWQLLQLDLP
jgi:putative PIN family toxin of toxin-antitoxin system